MEVKELSLTSADRWNTFVDSSPQGSLFSKTWYLDAIGVTYKILVVERGEDICAGMILSNWKGLWTFGPMQKYTGILFTNFDGGAYAIGTNQRAAVKLLLEQARGLGTFDYFFHPTYTDWLLWYQAGFKETTYYTYRIGLTDKTDEDLINLCAPRLRTKIRKAAKDASLEIIEGLEPDLFYEVNSKTFERQGGKMPISKQLFLKLYKTLAAENNIALYAMKNAQGEISSVLGIAFDKGAAYLLFSGFDNTRKDGGHNELLIYSAICKARSRVATFDFEGSMLPGIESFYRQFGGVLTPYFRIYRPSLLNWAKQSGIKYYKKLVYGK